MPKPHVRTLRPRRKIDLLLGLRLGAVTGLSAPLGQIMREISAKARACGLTGKKLDELLREA